MEMERVSQLSVSKLKPEREGSIARLLSHLMSVRDQAIGVSLEVGKKAREFSGSVPADVGAVKAENESDCIENEMHKLINDIGVALIDISNDVRRM